MTNKICDGCETVAHCLKNGCVPKTTKQTQVRSTEEAPARSALKLALEALNSFPTKHLTPFISSARTAIREALAEPSEALASEASEESSGVAQPAQPQQEPVSWMDLHKELSTFKWDGYSEGWNSAIESVKEYLVELAHTSPPTLSLAQRQARSADTWVGLTTNEVEEIFQKKLGYYPTIYAVEAKLKAKNSP